MIIDPYKIKHKESKIIGNKKTILESEVSHNTIIFEIMQHIIVKNPKEIETADRKRIEYLIKKYLETSYPTMNDETVSRIVLKTIDRILGYDILQKYIEDSSVTDIRAVKYNEFYIKKLGSWQKTEESFKNETEFEDFVRYAVLKNGSIINYEEPIVVVSDKKYHMRIEAGIPPSNIIGPNICFRIHRFNEKLDLETLFAKYNMFDLETYKFFINAVKKGKNIIICGKGGSGKTTLLRALINKIPEELAITTNEETAELYLNNKNVIQREVINRKKQENDIDLEKLTKHALVMSNDVIIIGELKGKEANTFFDAISTGHIGYATLHSDSAKSVLDRIIVLIKKDIRAQGYSEKFLKEFLARTIDYVVYMENYKVNNISKIELNEKNERVVIKEMFVTCFSGTNIAEKMKINPNTLNYLQKVIT